MRPNSLEALKGIQAALNETVLPELQTVFAQDTAGVLQLLLESLAGELDTAAEDMRRDGRTMAALLADARAALQPFAGRNAELSSLVSEIGAARSEPEPESVVLSVLGARHVRLRAVLEKTICALEDRAADPEFASLLPARSEIYKHLRDVSMRGWAFWDMASFRELMTRLRATPRA